MNEHLVAWVGYKKAQVWDRQQQRLITLEDGKGQIKRQADRRAGLRAKDGS